MANKYICNTMNLEYRYQFFGNLKQTGIFHASKEALLYLYFLLVPTVPHFFISTP